MSSFAKVSITSMLSNISVLWYILRRPYIDRSLIVQRYEYIVDHLHIVHSTLVSVEYGGRSRIPWREINQGDLIVIQANQRGSCVLKSYFVRSAAHLNQLVLMSVIAVKKYRCKCYESKVKSLITHMSQNQTRLLN